MCCARLWIPMGLPQKAGEEVLVERSHVSSKEHPTDLASVVSGLITTSGHETNRRSSRRCRNKTVAHRDRINPRHDSASTTCVTIHRKHLGRDSPSEVLGSCQTYLPPAQGRRGGSGTAPCAYFIRLNSYLNLDPNRLRAFACGVKQFR